jgi:phosphoenolpyruvate-protein kinase (PTS system EI component)
VDRGNSRLARKYDPFHPAVVRLMDRVARAGLEAGIEVGVCGEVAANPVAAFMLIGMRVSSLSVGPASLAEIKKVIRSVSFADAQEAVQEALAAPTSAEVLKALVPRLGAVLDLEKFSGA